VEFHFYINTAFSMNTGQGDHSPDNVKYPGNSVRSTRHVKCYSYHACTSTKCRYGCKYAVYNKQF